VFTSYVRVDSRVFSKTPVAHPRVACVIPGFRNERQARSNLSATGKAMSDADLAYVREALA
jgi:aryl-alcohol dehydrogenase-like predicted oxidoreductase